MLKDTRNTYKCCTCTLSPTDKAPLPIEPAPQLPFRFYNLPFQDRELHNPLTILWSNSREPNSLAGLAHCSLILAIFLLLTVQLLHICPLAVNTPPI